MSLFVINISSLIICTAVGGIAEGYIWSLEILAHPTQQKQAQQRKSPFPRRD
jgi:hypothetical protein